MHVSFIAQKVLLTGTSWTAVVLTTVIKETHCTIKYTEMVKPMI